MLRAEVRFRPSLQEKFQRVPLYLDGGPVSEAVPAQGQVLGFACTRPGRAGQRSVAISILNLSAAGKYFLGVLVKYILIALFCAIEKFVKLHPKMKPWR